MTIFADGRLLKWLQDLNGYPYSSKTALGNMYEYLKVGIDEAESEWQRHVGQFVRVAPSRRPETLLPHLRQGGRR